MKNKKHTYFFRIWPFWLISALVALFFWKVFFLGKIALPADFVIGTYYPWLDYKWGYPAGVPVKNPITTDVVSYTYPIRILTIEILKRGNLPLWNPYILTGIPLLASLQSAPFTLTNIFYFLTDNLTAWNLQIVSQHLLVALFTYILLRNWKVSKIGSVFGGILFAFSGFNLIWSQWNERSLTAAFIPLLIFFQEQFFFKGNWFYGFGFSLAIFFQIATGYPQVVLYTLLALLIRIPFILQKNKVFFFRLAMLTFFLFAGLGLSAIQIVPFQELLNSSQRVVEPIGEEEVFFPLKKVITFIAPDYYGNPATGNYWGTQDYTSITGFVGITAFVLSTLAFRKVKKKSVTYFVIFLAVTSLVLSFPTPISVFIWKSRVFGLQAAMAHRGLVLFTFSISVLAALGLDRVAYLKDKFYLLFFLPLVLLSFFGIYSLVSYLNAETLVSIGLKPQDYNHAFIALKNLVFPLLFFVMTFLEFYLFRKNIIQKKLLVALLITLAILEVFRFGWKYSPFSSREMVYPKTPVIDFLTSQEKPFRVTTTDVIPINIKMAYGLESLEGYGAIYPLKIAELIAYLNSEDLTATPQGRYGTVTNLSSHLLDLTNTKYLLTLKQDESGRPNPEGEIPTLLKGSKNLTKVFEDKTTVVLENKNSLPRAFMVYNWEVVKDKQEVVKRLIDENYPFAKKAILTENTPLSPPGQHNFNNSVTYKKYSEQESMISVNTDSYGLLFISDLYYPGWVVFLDDKETKIYLADYTFRAIFIPPGEHIVKLIYKPESFYRGTYYSIFSFILLLVSFKAYILIGKLIGVSYTSTITHV